MAVEVRISETAVASRKGAISHTNAAVPVTTGAANDVPKNGSGPPTTVLGPDSVSRTALTGPPGANKSAWLPLALYSAAVLPKSKELSLLEESLLSTAPTARTPV